MTQTTSDGRIIKNRIRPRGNFIAHPVTVDYTVYLHGQLVVGDGWNCSTLSEAVIALEGVVKELRERAGKKTMISLPKPLPRLLTKRDRAAQIAQIDRQQRELCKQRSGGRCEVREVCESGSTLWLRCTRPGMENHHLLGGWGRRNRGKSLLAAHRIQCCARCHLEITNHVLVPAVSRDLAESAETVFYRRITG